MQNNRVKIKTTRRSRSFKKSSSLESKVLELSFLERYPVKKVTKLGEFNEFKFTGRRSVARPKTHYGDNAYTRSLKKFFGIQDLGIQEEDVSAAVKALSDEIDKEILTEVLTKIKHKD